MVAGVLSLVFGLNAVNGAFQDHGVPVNFNSRGKMTAQEFLDSLRGPEMESADTKMPPPTRSPRKKSRTVKIAVFLAIATILSTFWAGVVTWEPFGFLAPSLEQGSLMPVRQALLANWLNGVQFALALMAILVAHELGHYILTIIYRVPSTPPMFIPFPFISPIGTMGAVILMQSGSADRKQIFDIGLAGPLAGLVVACPIIAFGILHSDAAPLAGPATLSIGQPLLIQWFAYWLVPEQSAEFARVLNTQVSPYLMAGWVGLLVTGINMMPLGQLDGGHVTFGLLGPKSYWVALATTSAAVAYMAYGYFANGRVPMFAIMLLLVLLMGLRHPPSSDDTRSLGLMRHVVGWLSLALPLLCIPMRPLDVLA